METVIAKFVLEIYEPGDERTILAVLASEHPLAMAVGEFVHTGPLLPDAPKRVLVIERIENTFLLRKTGVEHKRMVFTRTPG